MENFRDRISRRAADTVQLCKATHGTGRKNSCTRGWIESKRGMGRAVETGYYKTKLNSHKVAIGSWRRLTARHEKNLSHFNNRIESRSFHYVLGVFQLFHIC